MLRWGISTALLILTLFSGTARAYLEEGQPLPQTRSFYVRGLAGMMFYRRLTTLAGNAFVGNFGAELGVTVLQMEPNDEFGKIILGVHFDTFSTSSEVFTGRQTSILGQLLLAKSEEISTYFGPEFGMRNYQDDLNGISGSSMVAGFVAGAAIPLTTHLTYGPQFEALYAFPIDLSAVNDDTALMCKVHFALTYHF